MAIQVPVINDPQAPQAVNPLPFVSGYLDRKQQLQMDTMNRMQNVSALLNQYIQQKNENQLGALGAYASIAKAVGPDAANQVAGQIPNLPKWGQTAPTPTPLAPGAVPPAPSSQVPSSTIPAPTGDVSQSFQPSEHIQASVAAGAPDFTGHLAKIQGLQAQLAGYANKGDWGKEQALQVSQQIQAEKAAMDAEVMPQNYAKTAQEIALAKTKPVAEEVSKQTQGADEVRQLKSLYTDLQSALTKNPSTLSGNISGKVAQITGGRVGSQSAQDVLNAANPLATTLNTVLSRRFNSGEVQLLSQSLIPQPKDLPEVRQQKMVRLGKMIQTMEQGNEQNIRNVGSALMGNIPSLGSQPSAHVNAPGIGQIVKGYKFKGGDPSSSSNWIKQ